MSSPISLSSADAQSIYQFKVGDEVTFRRPNSVLGGKVVELACRAKREGSFGTTDCDRIKSYFDQCIKEGKSSLLHDEKVNKVRLICTHPRLPVLAQDIYINPFDELGKKR